LLKLPLIRIATVTKWDELQKARNAVGRQYRRESSNLSICANKRFKPHIPAFCTFAQGGFIMSFFVVKGKKQTAY